VSSRAGGRLDGRARWGNGYKRRRDNQASAGPVAPVPAHPGGSTRRAHPTLVSACPPLYPRGDPQPTSVTQDTPAPPIWGAAAAGAATPTPSQKKWSTSQSRASPNRGGMSRQQVAAATEERHPCARRTSPRSTPTRQTRLLEGGATLAGSVAVGDSER
jgi:hypothetical protein